MGSQTPGAEKAKQMPPPEDEAAKVPPGGGEVAEVATDNACLGAPQGGADVVEGWGDTGAADAEAAVAAGGDEIAEWQPEDVPWVEPPEGGSQTPEAAAASTKVLKIDHSGYVKVTLAWADEPVAAEEEWPPGGGEDEAAYALSALALAHGNASGHAGNSSGSDAEVLAQDDQGSEHALDAIGPAESSKSSSSHSSCEADEEEENEEPHENEEEEPCEEET